MNCLLSYNRFSGFQSSHTRLCPHTRNGSGPCEESTTHHVAVGVSKERPRGFYCGNYCEVHSKAFVKSHQGEVTEAVFILETLI